MRDRLAELKRQVRGAVTLRPGANYILPQAQASAEPEIENAAPENVVVQVEPDEKNAFLEDFFIKVRGVVELRSNWLLSVEMALDAPPRRSPSSRRFSRPWRRRSPSLWRGSGRALGSRFDLQHRNQAQRDSVGREQVPHKA